MPYPETNFLARDSFRASVRCRTIVFQGFFDYLNALRKKYDKRWLLEKLFVKNARMDGKFLLRAATWEVPV
jgi:hypothetical protein